MGWGDESLIKINGLGHMTKVAVMPIYGKNLKKSSFLEPKSTSGYLSTTKFVQMMALQWP